MDTQITLEQYKKDMSELKWENRIQTFAVILVFFWGIETLRDIKAKL